MQAYTIKDDVVIYVDKDLVEALDKYNWRVDKQGRVIAWEPNRKLSIGLIKYVWRCKTNKVYTKRVKRIDNNSNNYCFSNLTDVKTTLVDVNNGVATLSTGKLLFKVDAKFASSICLYNWRNDGKGYLRTSYYGHPETPDAYVALHQFIYFLEHGVVINGYRKGMLQLDHRDKDRANNCLINLRVVDHSLNNLNRDIPPGKTGHKYVYEFNQNKGGITRYFVRLPRLKYSRKTKVFDSLQEAIYWRDKILNT